MAEHPDVLTQDIAARFVVGLGQDKAYTGLKNMVDWVSGCCLLVEGPNRTCALAHTGLKNMVD